MRQIDNRTKNSAIHWSVICGLFPKIFRCSMVGDWRIFFSRVFEHTLQHDHAVDCSCDLCDRYAGWVPGDCDVTCPDPVTRHQPGIPEPNTSSRNPRAFTSDKEYVSDETGYDFLADCYWVVQRKWKDMTVLV